MVHPPRARGLRRWGPTRAIPGWGPLRELGQSSTVYAGTRLAVPVFASQSARGCPERRLSGEGEHACTAGASPAPESRITKRAALGFPARRVTRSGCVLGDARVSS